MSGGEKKPRDFSSYADAEGGDLTSSKEALSQGEAESIPVHEKNPEGIAGAPSLPQLTITTLDTNGRVVRSELATKENEEEEDGEKLNKPEQAEASDDTTLASKEDGKNSTQKLPEEPLLISKSDIEEQVGMSPDKEAEEKGVESSEMRTKKASVKAEEDEKGKPSAVVI